MSKVNTHYKDRLFRKLFGSIEYRDNILSLYNALNNTDYTNADDIELRTLSDAIYIKMKSDVAFLVGSNLVLWEQQSTINPNMPIRGMMYYADLYNAYITENRLNIYGTKLIKLPTPQYIVFYNGKSDLPAVTQLKLSDAFIDKQEGSRFEWTATMYNLCADDNMALLKKCKPLSDYMTLITYINQYKAQYHNIEDAVDTAVTRCIREDILTEILLKNRAEVKEMVITEYNEDVFVNGILEEGIEKGRVTTLMTSINSMTKKLNMTIDDAMSLLEVPDDERDKLRGLLS